MRIVDQNVTSVVDSEDSPNQVTVRSRRIAFTVISNTGHNRTDFRILPAKTGRDQEEEACEKFRDA
jgi:hypothetical protein